MRFIVVPILLTLLLMQTFSKWALILQYEINKDYITRQLCENKLKPQLQCNGNCLLMKKMKAEQKDNDPINNSQGKIITELPFLANSNSINTADVFQLTERIFNSRYFIKKYTSPITAIFHPPC